MTRSNLTIPNDIGCLDTTRLRATFVSSLGFHCDAWHINRIFLRDGKSLIRNYIIKRYRMPCSMREIQVYQQDYRELRAQLGAMIPKAMFLQTRIDGEVTVLAVARAVTGWFNIANPAFETEVVPLLRRLTKARAQLQDFVHAAYCWYRSSEMRVIDLWGVDNLVLDNKQNVRYLDSFNVFFYPDLFHVIDEPNELLQEKIAVSLRRLEYLKHILKESNAR